MNEEEKINRLLNSIAKSSGGIIADEVKEIIIKQQKEIERLKEQKRGLLVETYKNNDEKDKEIERLKELLLKAGYKEIILNGKEEWEISEWRRKDR